MENKQNNRQEKIEITRRMFLRLGLWATGLVSTWGIFRFLSFDLPSETLLESITLGAPNTYTRGTKLYIPEVRAWLMRDNRGIYAVSATCTHLGCTIQGEEDKFACPCHGSQFDFSGRVLQGPATAALDHFQVSLSSNGLVEIDRREKVPPTSRLELEG